MAWLAWCGVLAAGGSEDAFVVAYRAIQEADQMSGRGDEAGARTRYTDARKVLEELRLNDPEWNPEVVAYRLKYVERKLGIPQTPAEFRDSTGADSARLGRLEGRVRELEAERDLLSAKLREALAARPASVDPAELQTAQENLRARQKEIALLSVRLQMAEAGQGGGASTAEVAALRAGMARAAAEVELARSLALTNAAVIRTLEAALVAAGSQKQALEIENSSLRSQLVRPPSAAGPVVEAVAMSKVVAERDELKRRYDAVLSELVKMRREDRASGGDALTNQVALLKARLEAIESKAEPYTAEELALLRLGTISGRATRSAAAGSVPSSSQAVLVMDRGRPMNEGRASPGEGAPAAPASPTTDTVRALLRRAAEQVGSGELKDAAVTLTEALSIAPRDAVGLRLAGRLALLENRDDDALNLLSLSAQLDPQDPETFHLLGLVLNRKGLRPPAEASLRRAIRLAPEFAAAHHDLAVVYVAQSPPAIELARWHYQRSLAAGQPADPALEKRLQDSTAASTVP